MPHAERADRDGVALAVSGGGFCATLYHLGALMRLNELRPLAGVLSHLKRLRRINPDWHASCRLATALHQRWDHREIRGGSGVAHQGLSARAASTFSHSASAHYFLACRWATCWPALHATRIGMERRYTTLALSDPAACPAPRSLCADSKIISTFGPDLHAARSVLPRGAGKAHLLGLVHDRSLGAQLHSEGRARSGVLAGPAMGAGLTAMRNQRNHPGGAGLAEPSRRRRSDRRHARWIPRPARH